MKCGGLRLRRMDRNRKVEVERVILLEMKAAHPLFLSPGTF